MVAFSNLVVNGVIPAHTLCIAPTFSRALDNFSTRGVCHFQCALGQGVFDSPSLTLVIAAQTFFNKF
jgi:hypothetical protein